ncbi:MAG TPA: hypothetical protein VJ891_16025 [Casimicrobiaceae bacterium]|nr:hypothetical protein [Casimicrobiaceae bacterium]
MRFARTFLLATAIAALVCVQDANGARKTVCTITVNSADERDTFRRYLPKDDYDFVELVERGRPDWLASACRKGVQCDVLLISGHFDGGDEFYSDRVDARESLPTDELARVSCSDACPGLFSKLKEVYLFGCNTLNADHASDPAALVRDLVRAGRLPTDAEQLAQRLDAERIDTNRDRMRMIFKDVPVIYGFSSKAPLGASAAPVLEHYFRSGGAAEVASGQPSASLLALFAPVSMTIARGETSGDPQDAYRRDVCTFADDRVSAAARAEFVHALLRRDAAEARMFLDPLEKYVSTIDAADHPPDVSKPLAQIAHDADAKARWLTLARATEDATLRTRMIALAARVGWLTPLQKIDELGAMIAERIARSDLDVADVELVCTLNADGSLDATLARVATAAGNLRDPARSAMLACLGNATARASVIGDLTSPRERDVRIAQVYLRHHPIADVVDIRGVAVRIASMRDVEGQVRALDALAFQRVSDRESLESLAQLFTIARTIDVQRAIAGVLIRSDYESIAKPELVRALRDKRKKSPDGRDLIDVLIRRMQASLDRAA